MAHDAIARAIEATLFASEEPLSVDHLAAHLGDLEKGPVREALRDLKAHYEGRGIALVERGKRWHFETAPDMAHLLRREKEQVRRLSRAATEVLAIIAYHEPVSRAEIESIRGVQTSSGTLDVLMEAGWIKLAGRREVPGRPVIYATTPEFLDHFGLGSRRDLPGVDELKAAGLLDPVDDAFEEAMDAAGSSDEDADASSDDAGDAGEASEDEAGSAVP
ncbi:SMC-Scp complex subunit ScpB [Qipengyuania nanhaisediminis]|uniref:SMC-Scp complex subunit ScpB n=1 Tax=Qipengyuania nanhaisediminis TaxID=604088 RepID=UPI0038B40E09